MVDRSFLDWPFFEPRHRELVTALESWCQAGLAGPETVDVDNACRNLVAALAADGWLRHSVSNDGRLEVRALCLMRETLARYSGLADFAFAMQGLGSGPVSLFGNREQRQRYLPPVESGQAIAAFALSEAAAGSDVSALATTAEAYGDGYILNGEKTWISNGGIADFYIVFARTGEAPGARGLSAFVVDAASAGLEIAERIEVIAPHPLATLRFTACEVPGSALLGEPGQGFKIAMATLDVFRSTVAAAALGFARRALDEALTHSSKRQLFGAPLAAMQLTQAKLADMAVAIDAAALLVYRAAWSKDNGAERVTREAAMAKLFATENAQQVIDQAVQLFGGLGVKSGSRVEVLYREIRALRIYEGATEVQQQIIARELLRGVG